MKFKFAVAVEVEVPNDTKWRERDGSLGKPVDKTTTLPTINEALLTYIYNYTNLDHRALATVSATELDKDAKPQVAAVALSGSPSTPGTPKEVYARACVPKKVPPFVFEAVNQLLVANVMTSTGPRSKTVLLEAELSQSEVIDAIIKASGNPSLPISVIHDKHFLDFEPHFIAKGWSVEYTTDAGDNEGAFLFSATVKK